MLEVDRGQVLAYRIAAHGLHREETDAAAAAVFDLGLQDSQRDTALLALAARLDGDVLNDGTVLLTGGHSGGPLNWNYPPFSFGESERYDPATGKWRDAAAMQIPRDEFRMLRLDSGKILAIGGLEYGGYDAGYQNSEIFDPATGTWGPLIGLTIGRAKFGAVKLADGRVLIAGGAAVLANAGPDGNHVLITKTDLFTE